MTHAPPLPDLSQLSDAEKDALIVVLWTQLDVALAANAELIAKVEAVGPVVPMPTLFALASMNNVFVSKVIS